MSSLTGGSSGSTAGSSIPNAATDNTGNFSTGLGSPDANSGLDSLNAGLMGPNAGTLPNGYTAGAGGNYTPASSASGISAGSLNGNTSFAMPNSSGAQLASQSLNANNVANSIAAGGKVANSTGTSNQQRPQGGSGRATAKAENFSAPVTNFAGANGGSQQGQSLIQMLQKYHPDATS